MVAETKGTALMNELTQCAVYAFEYEDHPPAIGQFHSSTCEKFVADVIALFMSATESKSAFIQAEYRGMKLLLAPSVLGPDGEGFHLYFLRYDADISRPCDSWQKSRSYYIGPPSRLFGRGITLPRDRYYGVSYKPDGNPRKKTKVKFFRHFDGALHFCSSDIDEVIL